MSEVLGLIMDDMSNQITNPDRYKIETIAGNHLTDK